MKRFKLILVALLALLLTNCKTIQYVPIETDTQVHIVDSVAIHYLDSIRIYEATRYRDMAWMGDTLRIRGQRSTAWAVADTTKEMLIGGLEEDKVEEKVRYVYRDREILKDSIRTVEKPVPVEVVKEVKVIPKFWMVFGIIGIVLSVLGITLGYFKLKSKGILSKILKSIKR